MEGLTSLCSLCGKEFENEMKLEAHEKSSHKIMLRKCKICGEEICSSKVVFDYHMKGHKSKNEEDRQDITAGG